MKPNPQSSAYNN